MRGRADLSQALTPATRDVAGCLEQLRTARLRAVVLGASAGGVEALTYLAPALAPQAPFSVVAVIHLPPESPSLMPSLLADRARLPVKEAESAEPLQPGLWYIAPPNYHLSIEMDGTFSLSNDEPVHYSRPSIDVLFESAALAFGRHMLAVLLTGANHDGAAGVAAVRRAGGYTIVQDPTDAALPEMPLAALRLSSPDCLLTLERLRALLTALSTGTERKLP